MERVIETFEDHESADEADRRYYGSLTPQERVDLVLELMQRYRESYGEAGNRLERVCRVTELHRLRRRP
jgi:hypothetical protein